MARFQGRQIGMYLKRKSTSVVYCHIKEGCKYAAQNMASNNGIARAANGTLYVAHTVSGGLSVLEEQSDNTLVLTDYIRTGQYHSRLPHHNYEDEMTGVSWQIAQWTTWQLTPKAMSGLQVGSCRWFSAIDRN
jgi:hypothetical protein